MVKAAGIDAGTKSMDIYGFDDESGDVLIDEAIPRDLVTEKPEIVVEKIKSVESKFGKFDAIAISSGYGVPLKRAKDASDEEIRLATFVTDADVKRRLRIIGLRELMFLFRKSDLNAWFTPGVVHLKTVPSYRKANKIDMGTSDKIYSTVLAIKDQAERMGIKYSETSFILVEVGFAYTSAIAVEGGKIVDGVAGTAGFPSYLSMGFMDSELAYALINRVDDFSKSLLFSGGAADYAGINPYQLSIEDFVELAYKNDRVAEAYKMMMEGIIKDVAALMPTVSPREIILSGRFSRVQKFFRDAKKELEHFLSKFNFEIDVVKLNSRAKVAKEAAEGAAILANGIANGRYSEILDVMKLKDSGGRLFDNVLLPDAIKSKILDW